MMTFGDEFELPIEVSLQIISACSRPALGSIALVCREWQVLSLIERSTTPASAKDIAVRMQLLNQLEDVDGEYEIWRHGDRSIPPMRLYCRNVLSRCPTEFVTLPTPADGVDANWSIFPSGGAAAGSDVRTVFKKLRINPRSLMTKTDDYTFASTEGGLLQTYWNGQRRVRFTEVPFATARSAAASGVCGAASIDLSATGFCVDVGGFQPMGCSAWGVVLLPGLPLSDDGAILQDVDLRVAVSTRGEVPTLSSVGKRLTAERLLLAGGGFAGRLSPELDVTLDERAEGGNYDNEGRSGGWVLPLMPTSAINGDKTLERELVSSDIGVLGRSLRRFPGGLVRPCWGCKTDRARAVQ